MKILHIISVVNPNGNGVVEAVSKYIEYEQKNNEVALYNLDVPINNINIKEFGTNYENITDLPDGFSKPDLVIFNEVYKPKYISLYKECLKRNIKYIIIPHGCLVRDNQKKNRVKKLIGNLLLFKRFIKKAVAIQFLNEDEKNNTNFSYNNYIICGNGVTKPSYHNNNTGKKNIIFIGRYDINVKGLDLLCDICEEKHEWFIENNVSIELYGRDSCNNLSKLYEMINSKRISDIISINDAVYGDDKKNVLKDAYLFIQCSRHEGQPMGVLEALSVGVPCILTYGTSFGNYVNEKKCGVGCDFNIYEVFEAIKKLCTDQSLRNDYSKNAIENVLKDYEWSSVIENTITEYKKIH